MISHYWHLHNQTMYRDFWICVSILILLGVFYILYPWIRAVRLAFKLPGPPALPLLGNCLLMSDMKEVKTCGDNCYRNYGRVFRVWMSVLPTVVVTEPDDLKKILGSTKNTDKSFFYSLLHNFIGDGLVSHNGMKWKIHRKVIQPAFTMSALETYMDTFVNGAHSFISKLDKFAKNGECVNITTYANECVFDMLNENILGIPITHSRIKNHDESPFRQCKLTLMKRFLYPWLLFSWFYKFTRESGYEQNHKERLDAVIKESMERIKLDRLRGVRPIKKCFMEMLMDVSEENSQIFNEDDVIQESCTFMLAGQEAVAAAFVFSLYEIANDQTVQKKVVEELTSIFGNSERDCTINDFNRMHYLEQCIKETLRLHPSLPLISRKISEDVAIGNYVIPAETNVFIVPFVTHRLPHIYPNPEKFDPDRFSSEKIEKLHPYAFIPFSAGPRNCIGYKFAYLELKSMLSTLLRKYHVTLEPNYKFDEKFRVTLRIKGGLWLKLQLRKSVTVES